MAVSIRLNKNQDKLIITLPVEKARASASGKTILIATSRGAKSDQATHDGHPVYVVANAFVYNDEQTGAEGKTPRSSRKKKVLGEEIE